MQSSLRNQITRINEKFDTLTTREELLIERKRVLINKIEGIKKQMDLDDLAILILKDYLDVVTKEVVELFESTVTAGLKRIFDDSYEFKLDIISQKTKKVCNFLIHTSEYKGFLDLSYTQGTCLKQVISVIIRTIMVSLDPTVPDVISLDEPFSGGDDARMPAIAEFLSEITEKFKIQLIMVTHKTIFESYAKGIIRI